MSIKFTKGDSYSVIYKILDNTWLYAREGQNLNMEDAYQKAAQLSDLLDSEVAVVKSSTEILVTYPAEGGSTDEVH